MLGPARMSPRRPGDDASLVHQAAGVLRIHEFMLFMLAYRQWYGSPGEVREIERHFMLYLYRRRAPVWVRHFARQVVARSRQGPVRAQDYGVAPVLPGPPDPRTQRLVGALLAAFYLACFALVTWHAI